MSDTVKKDESKAVPTREQEAMDFWERVFVSVVGGYMASGDSNWTPTVDDAIVIAREAADLAQFAWGAAWGPKSDQ